MHNFIKRRKKKIVIRTTQVNAKVLINRVNIGKININNTKPVIPFSKGVICLENYLPFYANVPVYIIEWQWKEQTEKHLYLKIFV